MDENGKAALVHIEWIRKSQERIEKRFDSLPCAECFQRVNRVEEKAMDEIADMRVAVAEVRTEAKTRAGVLSSVISLGVSAAGILVSVLIRR